MRRRRFFALASIGLLLAGCAEASPSGASPAGASPSGVSPSATLPPDALAIYGAASLKGALDRIAAAYPVTHPGTVLTIATGSSAALEAQIEQGAPADVFLSADTKNPQKLAASGLAGEVVPFAGNVLTIIVPAANPAGIHSPLDLARPGIKVIAAGDAVPITGYATRLVANLAGQPGYPPGFEAVYAANIVSREDNVSAIVSKVALGEGDAGIVYVTDARTSTAVATLDVPPVANVVATYAGTVIRGSRHQASAGAFLGWLAGPNGQEILSGFGFLAPE